MKIVWVLLFITLVGCCKINRKLTKTEYIIDGVIKYYSLYQNDTIFYYSDDTLSAMNVWSSDTLFYYQCDTIYFKTIYQDNKQISFHYVNGEWVQAWDVVNYYE